ncbi:hypothetical protein [Endozoicomonas acroporae]|uniref:hypothetical protein n=1 Tax=Endozoicomonas acroporae TaxID=1701104 RepID=UPI003D7A29B9
MKVDVLPELVFSFEDYSERTPALKISCSFHPDYMGASVSLSVMELWIDCDVWDNWLSAISQKSDYAELIDLDRDFQVGFEKLADNLYKVRLNIEINEVSSPITRLSYDTVIDDARLTSIIDSSKEIQ